MEEILTKISGSVELVRYRNEETGYTVLEVKYNDELVCVVGKLPFVNEGENIIATGKWVTHKAYGPQFQCEMYEKSMPADVAAILKYLSSGAVKGIGMITAQRIVDMFGEKSLEVIEKEPEKLVQIKGISPKKAEEISACIKEQYGVRSLLLFFQSYGISLNLVLKIYKRWGELAIDKLKNNPYLLCEEIQGVGFAKSDEIASRMGMSSECPERLRAGIKYVLSHNTTNGHTYLPRKKLAMVASEMLEVDCELIDSLIEELVKSSDLIQEFFDKDRPCIFMRYYYEAEEYVALRLCQMCSMESDTIDSSNKIKKIEKKNGIEYAQMQKEAIVNAINNKVMILTGGPGTGKTTTLKGIIDIFEDENYKVLLCAPTGRAAKRMEELCGREAKTIHRLLEMGYSSEGGMKFQRNEHNLLDADAIIVDEISMVDIILFQALLRAMPLKAKLIMVGDADQLPPVGAGNALRDMLNSGIVPSVCLNEIFRQASQSLIVVNSHKIINGEMPDLSQKNSDFFFMKRMFSEQVCETIVDLMNTRLKKAYGFSPINDIQVLCPGRKFATGTIILNNLLRDSLNPPSKDKIERNVRDVIFREGDKVMQTRNNYDALWEKDNGECGMGIFNGDIGILESIDLVSSCVKIRFDDRIVYYHFDELDQIEHAFAITVHKSQGSEFPLVIIPIFDGAPKLFYRNLLYTAVTRAKQIVIIVGDEKKVSSMVNNNMNSVRYTGLCSLIRRIKTETDKYLKH